MVVAYCTSSTPPCRVDLDEPRRSEIWPLNLFGGKPKPQYSHPATIPLEYQRPYSRHISQTSTISKNKNKNKKQPYTSQISAIHGKKYPTPLKHPRFTGKNTWVICQKVRAICQKGGPFVKRWARIPIVCFPWVICQKGGPEPLITYTTTRRWTRSPRKPFLFLDFCWLWKHRSRFYRMGRKDSDWASLPSLLTQVKREKNWKNEGGTKKVLLKTQRTMK